MFLGDRILVPNQILALTNQCTVTVSNNYQPTLQQPAEKTVMVPKITPSVPPPSSPKSSTPSVPPTSSPTSSTMTTTEIVLTCVTTVLILILAIVIIAWARHKSRRRKSSYSLREEGDLQHGPSETIQNTPTVPVSSQNGAPSTNALSPVCAPPREPESNLETQDVTTPSYEETDAAQGVSEQPSAPLGHPTEEEKDVGSLDETCPGAS